MRRGSETFLKAIFGKSNEQKEAGLGLAVWCPQTTERGRGQGLFSFLFFLSRRMILELRKEDQTWLRGKRCPEGVRGERKGPNLTECSLGPRRREAAPPSQKNPASEAHSCLPLGLSFHVDLFVWCTPAPSQTPLEVMGLEINRTILAPQELIQVDR